VLLVSGLGEFVGKAINDPKHLFDIEFLGGTKAQVTLRSGLEISDGQLEAGLRNYRSKVDGVATLDDVSVSRVLRDETAGRPSGPTFDIKTTNIETARFQQELERALRDPQGVIADQADSLLPAQAQLDFRNNDTWANLNGGESVEQLAAVNVRKIEKAYLDGEGFEKVNLADYLGGVAILVEGLEPARTVKDLEDRIDRKLASLDKRFKDLPKTGWKVIPIEPAGADESGTPLYSKVLYVAARSGITPTDAATTGDADKLWAQNFALPQARLVQAAFSEAEVFDSISSFAPNVAGNARWKALVAIVMAMIAIVIYVWVRFGSWLFGLGAILPLLHDVAIVLGLLALSKLIVSNVPAIANALLITDFRIDMAVVAAVLTVIGYSLNDTIVIFDRIRENRGRLTYVTPKIIDDSINQNISRTVLTSLTTFIAVFIMYVFGGPGIHGLTFALLVGLVVGTYSSIAVASPVVMGWSQALMRRAVEKREAAANNDAD
jgi:SecD/SecF fusion protein